MAESTTTAILPWIIAPSRTIKTPTPTKRLEEISLEEIDNDFKLLKSKSEEKLCNDDISDNIFFPNTRPDSNEFNYRKQRCVNPFYKNFENENEEYTN